VPIALSKLSYRRINYKNYILFINILDFLLYYSKIEIFLNRQLFLIIDMFLRKKQEEPEKADQGQESDTQTRFKILRERFIGRGDNTGYTPVFGVYEGVDLINRMEQPDFKQPARADEVNELTGKIATYMSRVADNLHTRGIGAPWAAAMNVLRSIDSKVREGLGINITEDDGAAYNLAAELFDQGAIFGALDVAELVQSRAGINTYKGGVDTYTREAAATLIDNTWVTPRYVHGTTLVSQIGRVNAIRTHYGLEALEVPVPKGDDGRTSSHRLDYNIDSWMGARDAIGRPEESFDSMLDYAKQMYQLTRDGGLSAFIAMAGRDFEGEGSLSEHFLADFDDYSMKVMDAIRGEGSNLFYSERRHNHEDGSIPMFDVLGNFRTRLGLESYETVKQQEVAKQK
jgi:hypothetical protein